MGIADDLKSDTNTIFGATWHRREGQAVPETDDVALKNGAVDLEAVVLYADLADSTELAQELDSSVAAKIVRAYLSSMTRLITYHGGKVRSFDGDRVMGVFIGDGKASSAAKCALRMNWMVSKVLRPTAESKFPSVTGKGFTITHCVGAHQSKVLVVRAGIRGSNDLVFVGRAPNLAAKLSDIRNSTYKSYITWHVHKYLNSGARLTQSDNKPMWEAVKVKLAGKTWDCFRSKYTWSP